MCPIPCSATGNYSVPRVTLRCHTMLTHSPSERPSRPLVWAELAEGWSMSRVSPRGPGEPSAGQLDWLSNRSSWASSGPGGLCLLPHSHLYFPTTPIVRRLLGSACSGPQCCSQALLWELPRGAGCPSGRVVPAFQLSQGLGPWTHSADKPDLGPEQKCCLSRKG